MVGQVVAGRYRIERFLGTGGMGSVHAVRHVHTDELLALKTLHAAIGQDAEAVERFRREARAPARIESEHIARVTDADTAPELGHAPFYVMELLRGRDLAQVVQDDGPLPPALVVEYLRQAARALDKAHAAGIIHRDLKPENLFLTHREDGSACIKLVDFGIARLADVEVAGPTRTRAGYVLGTPAYMAPEQALGDPSAVGPWTDVWALGLVAFELLTGRRFWDAEGEQLYVRLLVDPIALPSSRVVLLGPAFDTWFVHCVNRDVRERFSAAGEAVAALAEAFGQTLARPSAVSVAPARPLTVPPPASRATGFIVGVGLCAIAALLVVFVSTFALHAYRARVPAVGLVPAAPQTQERAVAPPPEAPSHGPPPALPPSEASAPHVISASPAALPSTLTREQRRRLEVLERLCAQGTFTPAECAGKRAAILHGNR
ncbi:serine/threonine protein kinase [Labilithrix luteola]|uniref:Serine/threonine protein kinase n=1 Tax=Labilithrix luteola TaxID=1391654 RepID=A0A0K1QFP9_9BACT|nr:serine/threonine protein kinase [Labilithrix luteola]